MPTGVNDQIESAWKKFKGSYRPTTKRNELLSVVSTARTHKRRYGTRRKVDSVSVHMKGRDHNTIPRIVSEVAEELNLAAVEIEYGNNGCISSIDYVRSVDVERGFAESQIDTVRN